MGETFREFAETWCRSTDAAERPATAAAGGDRAEPQRAVRALVHRTPVRTMAHVDALIALRDAAPHPCTLAELTRAARVPPGTVAQRCVDDLVVAGLATRVADRDAYRFAPETAALRAAVDALVALRARGGTLVRLLGLYAAEPRRGAGA
jgi:hypothetical protein